jgi:hypothetical protein
MGRLGEASQELSELARVVINPSALFHLALLSEDSKWGIVFAYIGANVSHSYTSSVRDGIGPFETLHSGEWSPHGERCRMASVTYDHVTKRFGDVVAVNDLSLEILDREFLAAGSPPPCAFWPAWSS